MPIKTAPKPDFMLLASLILPTYLSLQKAPVGGQSTSEYLEAIIKLLKSIDLV